MVKDLIYDVGAHVGHDTAYYLHRGFRVVAVEANPRSIQILRERFASEILSQQLTVVEKAITLSGESIDLFISASDSGSCSTFKDEVDDISERVPVEGCRFSEILKEYGVPFYLKIDIQGADMICLQSLSSDDLPQYVSWELDREQLSCMELMRGLGFKHFKFIDQTCFKEMSYSLSISRKIDLKVKKILGLDSQKGVTGDWQFKTGHSSGPFAEDTDGKWRTFEEVYADWIKYSQKYPTRQQQPAWFDCHARLS